MTPVDNGTISMTDYANDGYVFLQGLMSPHRVGELNEQIARYVRDVVPTLPPEHVFYEDPSRPETLKQLQRMQDRDAWFGELMHEGELPRIAATLLDGPVVAKNMQYFNKPPGVGQATPPHQDGYYFMIEPCEAVTMWLALEDVDKETGCVRYVRGSHRLGTRLHGRTKTLGFSQAILDYPCPNDLDHEIAFPASAGDLLVHHALTIHRADANTSATRTRRALGLIYYSERAKVDEVAHAAYQQRLKEQMLEEGKI